MGDNSGKTNEIEAWYDNQYDEWNRLERHRIEFDLTRRYLDEHLTGEGVNIFDIGGGPGRYALDLAAKGHRVTLLDLSGRNLEVAREKAAESHLTLEGYIHGDALKLEEYETEAYDAVLLMGPLYHLVREEDRKTALRGALRLLKPGGILVAAFISRYAPLMDYLIHLEEPETPESLLHYLDDGLNKDGEGFTTAYFTGVEEARSLMEEHGVAELAFAGIENVLGIKEREITALPEQAYRKWLEIGYHLSKDPKVIGTSQHFLYVGRKL